MDIILEVNRTKILSMQDYIREIEKAAEKKKVILLIKRGSASFFVGLLAE
jgi:S1-C subfamily serine protease